MLPTSNGRLVWNTELCLVINFYSPIVASRKSLETRVDPDLLKQTCLLINTADYCQTTALEVFGSFDQLSGARIADVLISLKPRLRKRLMPSSKNKLRSRLNATYLSGNLFFHPIFSLFYLSFESAISTAINVILREFENNVDPSFITLSRTSWPTINQVSGPSPYTGELVKCAEQVVELIKPLIEQKKYLRNLFDKASRYEF